MRFSFYKWCEMTTFPFCKSERLHTAQNTHLSGYSALISANGTPYAVTSADWQLVLIIRVSDLGVLLLMSLTSSQFVADDLAWLNLCGLVEFSLAQIFLRNPPRKNPEKHASMLLSSRADGKSETYFNTILNYHFHFTFWMSQIEVHGASGNGS